MASSQQADFLDETWTISVRANTAARAWLNAFLAASTDEGRPILNRTICIEWFEAGVQFVACDGTVLFRSWVAAIDEENGETGAAWPELDEAPERIVVVQDVEGFGLGFMRSLLRVTGEEGHEYEPLTLTLAPMDDGVTLALGEEFASERVILRACGQRIDLRLYEAEFPRWRGLSLGLDDAERVDGLCVAPRVLSLVGKLKGVTAIDLAFAGEGRRVDFEGRALGTPIVRGLLMPMRRVAEPDHD